MSDASSTNKCEKCRDLSETLTFSGRYLVPECNHLCGISVSVASLKDSLKYFGDLFGFRDSINRSNGHEDFQATDVMRFSPDNYGNLPTHQLN